MTSETIARIAFALACNYRVYVKLRPDMGQENRDREQGYHDVRFWVPRASAHPFNGLGAFYSANDRGWPEAWEYDRQDKPRMVYYETRKLIRSAEWRLKTKGEVL